MENRDVREVTMVVGVLALALGCAGDPPDLEIARIQAPDPVTCTLADDGSGAELRSGTFDLSIGLRASYLLGPVLRNRLSEDVTFDTVHIDVYEQIGDEAIHLRFMCSEGACDHWALPLCEGFVSGCPRVPAGETASFEVPILPREITAYYQGMMDAAIAAGRRPPQFDLRVDYQLEGRTSEGVVSAPLESFELTVCLGCLVTFPAGTDSPSIPGPDCCGGGEPLPACLPGQDDPIDCRRCIETLPEICNFGRLSCA